MTIPADHSGFHWRSFEWFTDHTIKPIMNSIDRRGPSHEQIVELYEKLELLTEPLKTGGKVERAIRKNIVKRAGNTFLDYNISYKNNAATIIDRGSAYHKMKSQIEAGKGNKTSAVTHRLKAAGYSSLIAPACFGMLGYLGLGFLWCGPIEIGKEAYKAIRSPNKLKRIRERIRKYRRNRRTKQSFKRKVNSKFYDLVDEKI